MRVTKFALVLLVLATLAVILQSNSVYARLTQCYATGDPHYKTFSGFYYDLYGHEGDYMLTRSRDGAIEVHTRIKYHKDYANRGLINAVFVRLDGVAVELDGHTVKVDGEQIKAKAVTQKLAHGVILTRRNANHFLVSSTKTGAIIDCNKGNLSFTPLRSNTKHFWNVYVSIPDQYKGKMTGKCGTHSGSKVTDIRHVRLNRFWQLTPATSGFGKKVPVVKPQPVKHIPWKSKAAKKAAKKACKKDGLKGALLHACVADAKIAGKASVAKHMYKNVQSSLKAVKKVAKKIDKVIQKKAPVLSKKVKHDWKLGLEIVREVKALPGDLELIITKTYLVKEDGKRILIKLKMIFPDGMTVIKRFKKRGNKTITKTKIIRRLADGSRIVKKRKQIVVNLGNGKTKVIVKVKKILPSGKVKVKKIKKFIKRMADGSVKVKKAITKVNSKGKKIKIKKIIKKTAGGRRIVLKKKKFVNGKRKHQNKRKLRILRKKIKVMRLLKKVEKLKKFDKRRCLAFALKWRRRKIVRAALALLKKRNLHKRSRREKRRLLRLVNRAIRALKRSISKEKKMLASQY